MSNLEQHRNEIAGEKQSDGFIAPTKATLDLLERINQQGLDLLQFVYENWDNYDTLTQQSLPQMDYEKAIRLTSLARNTLEKFLDQFSEIEDKKMSDKELRDMLNRAKHTIRSLTQYYINAGVIDTESDISKAA